MFRSARRDRTEGMMDKMGGRILEAFGRLTGRTSHKVKGKAVRARGGARRGKGRMKRVAH
jgi:uncharacterized protein YjbJ (UPF0337 family)